MIGCRKKEDNQPGQDPRSKVNDSTTMDVNSLAHIDGQSVTTEVFQAYLNIRPLPDYGDFASIVAERLDELTLNEALYQEALHLQLDQDPRVRFRMQQFLVQSLMDQYVEGPARDRPVTEVQIAQYYQDHLDRFSRPAQRRVSEIFIAASDARQKAGKRALAQEVLQKTLATAKQMRGFRDLIAQHSDYPSDRAKGDTGYFDATGRPIDLPLSVIEAAFSLEQNGQIYDQVIESQQGFHIVRLINHRVAQKRDLEDVKHQIEKELINDRVKQAREAFFRDIRVKTKIEVNQEHLAEIIEAMGKGRERPAPALPGQ